MTNEERLTTIKAALDLGLQAWRATTARRRFVDAYDAVDALAAELAETQRALAEERTRHHSLRWVLGLEDHEGERAISDKEAVESLRALRRKLASGSAAETKGES